ncbi:hypothetical protein COLO4_25511 [Corchorus olitorius]|uniref:Uncharacterized protein n=1 Tax=Corchorus olitorius TaxID=93759 RepID=A0A1R3I1Z9_9ROSI|nr:hypothetical protein COLO4_25511 [Corchorus olitorius]
MDRRTGKKVRACGDGDKGKEAEGLMIEIDLPTGMIMEILSWLPFKPLLNCRPSSTNDILGCRCRKDQVAHQKSFSDPMAYVLHGSMEMKMVTDKHEEHYDYGCN